MFCSGSRAPWVTAFGLCTLILSAGAQPDQTAGTLAVDTQPVAVVGSSAQGSDQGTAVKTGPSSFGQSRFSALDSAAQGGANHIVTGLDTELADRGWGGDEKGFFTPVKSEGTPVASLSLRESRPASSAVVWSAAVGKPASSNLSSLAVDESGQVVAVSPGQSESTALPHVESGRFALVPTNFYSLVLNPGEQEEVSAQHQFSDRPLLASDNAALIANIFGDGSSNSNSGLVPATPSEGLVQAQLHPVRFAGDLIASTPSGNLPNGGGAANLGVVSSSTVGQNLSDRGMLTQMALSNQGGTSVSVVTLNVTPVPEPSTVALVACSGVLVALYAGFRKLRFSAF
jgi:hypothetical protein